MEAGPVRGVFDEYATTYLVKSPQPWLDFEARAQGGWQNPMFEVILKLVTAVEKKPVTEFQIYPFDKWKFFLYIPSPFPVFDPTRILRVGETAPNCTLGK